LEHRILDMSGLQMQRCLAEQKKRLPMVFATSNLDVSTAVALMRGGAIHVLEKPLRPIELVNAIHEGVATDQEDRRKEAEERRLRESKMMLTRKELELLRLIASAKSSKAIASELGICPRAVEFRRRGIMNKLGLKTSFDVLRFALLLSITETAADRQSWKPGLNNDPAIGS